MNVEGDSGIRPNGSEKIGEKLGKLFKLKEWLTVPDAARQLTILFGEDIGEADVLRLALDGHLTLSVHFVNYATARCGLVVPIQDAKRRTVKGLSGEDLELFDGLAISEAAVLEYRREVVNIQGVWDLAMVGAERLDVEYQYHQLTNGPEVTSSFLDGPIVLHEGGTYCQIMAHFDDNQYAIPRTPEKPRHHPDNYYPAGGLPHDSVLVVRTAAATAIESETTLMGARVAARTIENHLKAIPEALEGKAED